MNSKSAELRNTLDEIRRRCHVEMSNASVAQVWPAIAKLVEANTYADPEMRALALEHFVDHMVRDLGECRRRINQTNQWLADQEREAALTKSARPLRAVSG